MQIVATLGALRMKPDEVVENSTIKHSIPCSATESDTIGMEMHSEVLVSDTIKDPLFSKKSVAAVLDICCCFESQCRVTESTICAYYHLFTFCKASSCGVANNIALSRGGSSILQ